MPNEQEKQFEHLVPFKSVLGREFLALQAERNKQRSFFESAKDKMDFDTTPYRRSEIALGRFLDDMIPLVIKGQAVLAESGDRLSVAEEKILYSPIWGIKADRRSLRVIWMNFAFERVSLALPKPRRQFRIYHPVLWHTLVSLCKKFRDESRRWTYGGQPFDGSRAMHAMIDFQLQARLLGSVND